ncbi:MAG: quinolinate synthase NadA [Chloroflexota bacterium]|nr:MAG: quinolinate synthase NadA [Chloroflexota bacterium]
MHEREIAYQEQIRQLQEEIAALKRERNAVILAHNYQRPEVQDVADFVGDSLELSRKATTVDTEVIVFCGVHFMAESAKILNPSRTVLLPEITAGCPMADMIELEDLREWKARYPDAAVVCYVNSSAAIKAESDICCTSANALKVVEAVDSRRILFVPDQHLGQFVAAQTQKEVILYPGHCPTHRRLQPEHLRSAKATHPDAVVVVHPECTEDVVKLADVALSTSQMLRYVRESSSNKFLIGTEHGLLHRMRLENPDKTIYSASNALVCPNMKRTHLKSVNNALRNSEYVIDVPEETRILAKRALDRMLEVI